MATKQPTSLPKSIIHVSRLIRLMKIIKLARSKNGVALSRLMKDLRISRRTAFRDLNALEHVGVEIELTNKGYRVLQAETTCRDLLLDYHLGALRRVLG